MIEMRNVRGSAAALIACGIVFIASGTASGITLSDVNLGTHVYGPKWELESLKGRVVLIEYWDTG